MTTNQIESIDILQRKMIRRIVGWTRYENEDWADTMRRMRSEMEHALNLYPMEDWRTQLLRRQFRLICRFGQQGDGWPLRLTTWYPPNTYPTAHRK